MINPWLYKGAEAIQLDRIDGLPASIASTYGELRGIEGWYILHMCIYVSDWLLMINPWSYKGAEAIQLDRIDGLPASIASTYGELPVIEGC